jgi:hypothetical protein
MERLALLKLTQKYHGNIDVFNRCVKYKTSMQRDLHLMFNEEDRRKLKNDIRNEDLIPKLAVIVDNYQKSLDDSEETLFALTKSASVILSEIDMPEFSTLDGHLRFFNEYLKYHKKDD